MRVNLPDGVFIIKQDPNKFQTLGASAIKMGISVQSVPYDFFIYDKFFRPPLCTVWLIKPY